MWIANLSLTYLFKSPNKINFFIHNNEYLCKIMNNYSFFIQPISPFSPFPIILSAYLCLACSVIFNSIFILLFYLVYLVYLLYHNYLSDVNTIILNIYKQYILYIYIYYINIISHILYMSSSIIYIRYSINSIYSI